MRLNRKAIVALAGGALAVSAALPATAQDTKPVPTSCAGMAFEDPADDQALGPKPSPSNVDIRGGFFRYVNDANGKPVLTTNLIVTKLDKTVDPGTAGTSWYFLFTNEDQLQFTRVDVIDGTVTYQYGHRETDGLTVDGTTKGRFLEGDMGIVETVVPSAMGFAGKTLSAPEGEGRARVGAAGVTNSTVVDNGPDSGGGKDFKATVCTADSPGGSTPPPGGGGTTPPPGGGTTPPPSSSKPTMTTGGAKVKKRTVTVKLQASETLTNLKGKLLKGKKVLATGSLAQLPGGKGTMKLKVRKKSFKKGTYTLKLTGKDQSGDPYTYEGLIKVR